MNTLYPPPTFHHEHFTIIAFTISVCLISFQQFPQHLERTLAPGQEEKELRDFLRNQPTDGSIWWNNCLWFLSSPCSQSRKQGWSQRNSAGWSLMPGSALRGLAAGTGHRGQGAAWPSPWLHPTWPRAADTNELQLQPSFLRTTEPRARKSLEGHRPIFILVFDKWGNRGTGLSGRLCASTHASVYSWSRRWALSSWCKKTGYQHVRQAGMWI